MYGIVVFTLNKCIVDLLKIVKANKNVLYYTILWMEKVIRQELKLHSYGINNKV